MHHFLAINGIQPRVQFRALLGDLKVRCEFFLHQGIISKGEMLGILFNKEVKRVDHGHVRDHLHRELQAFRFFRKHQPRLIVAERILLPVNKVVLGRHFQGIAMYMGT